MLPLPTSYPTQNTHRVVQIRQDVPGCDFDALEDMTADVTRLTRKALADIENLPWDVCERNKRDLKDLSAQVEKRRVLTDDFRIPAAAILYVFGRVDVPDEAAELHDRVMRTLRDALNLSNRVSDLIAAEREICFTRNR